ncbi:MAG TPA: hypothetical protein VKB67_04855 [Rhizomicrobium sp.]|nr:hypothetical protein [Rhizomicrobium sp.]
MLKKPASWSGSAQDGAVLIPVTGGLPIVGMWSFTMTLNGGAPFDWGYQVWHDDGTEIMNSGTRAPATENFCMGAWIQMGARYHLNHQALSYTADGTLNARVVIKEDVMVDPRGFNFSGPFTVDIYNAAGTTLLQHLAGTAVGKRVIAN